MTMTMQQEIKRNLIPIRDLFELEPDWVQKRDRAIKKLYNGNANEFNQFISKIEPMEDWKNVLDAIEQEFNRLKVKSDGKEATGLTDVLFKRYFPSY